MKTLARQAFAVCLLAGAMACGPDTVTMPVRLPELEMPLPPPHVVMPAPPEPEPAAPAVATPVTPPTSTPVIQPTPARTDPPALPPRSSADVPPAGAPAPVPSTPVTVTQAEQKVRADIASATRDLARLDYKSLNANAKEQYNIAQGFLRQADLALKAKNIASAGSLAEKAKTMAALLVK